MIDDDARKDMRTLFTSAKSLLNRYGLGGLGSVLPELREERPEITVLVPKRGLLLDEVAAAMERTRALFLGQQHEEGYWWYELESNVTIVSEYMMLLHFLGLPDTDRDRKIGRHILRHQRTDGTWALYRGGPGDLSTTIEAYFGLRLAGHSAEEPELVQARDFILSRGGLEGARVFTKVYLALFGLYPWRAVPSIPVELNLFPPWFPLNIYNFSSWARSTVVPLSLVLETRPVRPTRLCPDLRELFRHPDRMPAITSGMTSARSWKRIFLFLDRIMKAVDGLPVRPLRSRAMKRTEQWVLEHQEHTGDWGGIQPAMINSLLGLTVLGHSVDSPPVRKGLEALKHFSLETENEIGLQSCISPVWDTALTSLALLASGLHREHPSLIQACGWLASKQIFRKGDWSVKRPDLAPGGWAFEFENSWYPDVDDTAVVLLLLRKYSDKDGVVKRENLQKGVDWVLGMQGSDGGWGAFDVDNDMRVLNQLLFGDLEAMIDPSTPDLTGRVLELLGAFGFGLGNENVRRAIAFIKANQEPDGSWWGRWGVNHLYGTCTVVCGLDAIGEDLQLPWIRKAVEWIKSRQNCDGGWGESCESYHQTPSNTCKADSTPSQAAWALLALIAAGEAASPEAVAGVGYLLRTQKEDGSWDEDAFTGTGFPRHFYLRYDNYRNCFPLMALGRFAVRNRRKGARP